MKKIVPSYLSQLRFAPHLWDSWHAKYITQIRLVIILIVSIVAVGIFAYLNIPRRLNPEIKIPIVIVSAVLPGAAPEEMESLVTIPLEDKLKAVENIDVMASTSRESSTAISIQFLSSANADKAKEEVQSAVDSVVLPSDVKDPTVTLLDFEDQPIWTFAIVGKTDVVSLMRFSKELQDRIENLSKVDRVTVSGYDKQEIEVIIDQVKMREYGISVTALSAAINRSAASYPAGSVETTTSSFALSIDKDIVSVEDIRNIRITIGTQTVRLADIATVGYKSRLNQQTTLYATHDASGTPAVQFFVYRSSNANIDAAEKDVDAEVHKTLAQYPGQFELVTINNSAEEIVTQFNELSRDFMFTIVLVFILLLIFLGFRQAVISSITVPLTFLSSFAIINALGLTLNFLTMFAFLIALGLLIDDTIVTVAAMTRYFATKRFTPGETGVLVWKDFIVPLWSTTITTIWAFLPLLLASGIIGEFIKSIPIVVTATMLSSTSIAVFITIPLMVIFLKPVFPRRVKILLTVLGILTLIIVPALFLPKNILLPIILVVYGIFLAMMYRHREPLFKYVMLLINKNTYTKKIPSIARSTMDRGILDIEKVSHRYMNIIDRILVSKHGKRNTLIAITVFALVAYLLVPLGLVKNEFFPKQNGELLYASVQLPAGTNLETNNKEMMRVVDMLRVNEETEFVIGESGQGFSAEGRAGDSSSFLITMHLTKKDERSMESSEIAQRLRDRFKNYSVGVFTVQELSGGPPAGADIQVTFMGDDLTQLDTYANKTMEFLKKQTGVTNVDKSIKPGTSKLVFVPDKEKLAENGLTIDIVALSLRTYASGFTLDTIKFGKDEEDVVFRTSETAQTPEDLGALVISSPRGNVPLLALGSITLSTNPTVITHEDGKRTLSVSASVVAGYNIQEKNADLEKFVKTLSMPAGYSWKTGGVNEENQKSVNSIMQAMLISFLLILITMVLEFRSFRQTFIALMIIPISIAGVFYVFALTNTPLSFPALIGILALFGIVVTHAIVVIEKINDNLREKMPLREAIVDAAGNRLEPVLLTSMATIAGLIPITISDPLWRGLGGAIIAGLLFSGLIKLFFVPVLYYLFFKDDPRYR